MIWTNICIGFEYTNIFVSKNLMLGFKLVIQPTVKTVFFLCILFLCILIYVDFLAHRLDFFSRIYLYQETIQTNIRIYSYQTNMIQTNICIRNYSDIQIFSSHPATSHWPHMEAKSRILKRSIIHCRCQLLAVEWSRNPSQW